MFTEMFTEVFSDNLVVEWNSVIRVPGILGDQQ